MIDREFHLRESETHVLRRSHGLLRVERHLRKDGLRYTQVSPSSFLVFPVNINLVFTARLPQISTDVDASTSSPHNPPFPHTPCAVSIAGTYMRSPMLADVFIPHSQR